MAAPGAAGSIAYMTSFNKKMKTLAVNLSSRFKSDADLWRAQERVKLASKEAPFKIMHAVGPVLLRYKDKIFERDAEFFLNSADFDATIATSAKKKDMAMEMMGKIKKAWVMLDVAERGAYVDLIIGLLEDYVEYLCADPLGG